MALIHWRGNAAPRAQEVTATPANVEAGDLFRLTINAKSVEYAAEEATAADVVAGLAAAVNQSELPEFRELEAFAETTAVRLVAREPGKPFEVAAAAIDGGSADTQTLTLSTVVASAGPHDWNTPANWSGGAAPQNGDDAAFEESDVSVYYGLDQSAVALDSLRIAASFTGDIGLPSVHRDGANFYREYRGRYLQIGAADVEIGKGIGGGSSRLLLDTGASATAITVYATGIPAEETLPAVVWRGSHAENTMNVRGGSVGIAVEEGDAAQLETLWHSGGEVRCGRNVAFDTIERSEGGAAAGGQLVLASGAQTLIHSGGETVVLGSAAIDAIDLDGGRIDFRSSGAIGEVTLDAPDAVLDFSADLRPRAVAQAELRQGTIRDPHRTVTWTNGVQPGKELRAG